MASVRQLVAVTVVGALAGAAGSARAEWRSSDIMANDEPAHSAPPPPPPPVQWIPEPWAQRAAGGALVWSATPVIGPMPNFGNGFAAAEFPTDATSAQMYIAGVFEGGLPPPFGKEMGGVSARAAVPLPLTQVRNGTGWHAVALANDFERATVELLLLRQAGDNEHDDAATPAAVVTRHYFHRESMHLLVAEVAVNNSAGAEPLELEVATLWPSGASRASSFKATSAGAGGPSCQIGTTTESERVMSGATAGTGMENVTVVVCYPRSGLTLRAAAGAAAQASTVVAIFSSRESADPLQVGGPALFPGTVLPCGCRLNVPLGSRPRPLRTPSPPGSSTRPQPRLHRRCRRRTTRRRRGCWKRGSRSRGTSSWPPP